MAITLRSVKGSALTHAEMDENFSYLEDITSLGILKSYIAGLTYSNNSTDPTNDIDIAVGKARDAGDTYNLVLSSTLIKQSDQTWAVGTNAGGLDTGVVGNSDYYIWLIARSDTGVVDALFSLSATAPTMPTNYDVKRLIGWFKRVGGTIVAFTTYETEGGGLELIWTTPTTDVNLAATLTTSRRTDAVKVPLNFSVLAHLWAHLDDVGVFLATLYCPDQSDIAAAAPNVNHRSHVAGVASLEEHFIRTSAAGLIAARANIATVDTYQLVTVGFHWGRRN